ncbi:TetR/AcrR family transcriptional regulator [Lysobacter solisilvae (ex Woo and Kim 2020)]|uniref:TetR/AcrR family transcriptional regulator n=1 Tax=Agrilutibacter terrestris TaxID=2865112 RepID=A0A7H0FWV4_9GAMM|nr:TetR/AcrR family transcriptional regulator [Lysobacter terrestris]QNP40520.1 TetR/AcrR family transcriptional regulator [Lysobacter terrestris]
MDTAPQGRPNQRRRTRKDLLQAATQLVRQGRKPSLEEIAEAAMVSRATAYRYFPRVDALLLEAALDVAVPEADALFERAPREDAVARVERVDDALHAMILAHEAQLRTMLVHSLQRGIDGNDDALPARQNRRSPLIEAALSPVRNQFKPAALKHLAHALALIIGTEAMVVCKDVLQLDDAEARKMKRWAIRALIEAARKSPAAG